MSGSFFTHCLALLSDVQPITGVLVAFAIGYLAIGFPTHVRAGGSARDVWGTAAGLCAAALYAFLITSVVPPAAHHHPQPTTISSSAH
ncbi:hypothetical protein [Paraburkholderia phosphatilytica]|uniref:hypothetical protein n=1 Tax=Paraburkholderia phosphatilytica TaxID=2282883 RepID=UPI00197DA5D2|nr:hypothetical protein [Paraburkholderia phosphatilytica]